MSEGFLGGPTGVVPKDAPDLLGVPDPSGVPVLLDVPDLSIPSNLLDLILRAHNPKNVVGKADDVPGLGDLDD